MGWIPAFKVKFSYCCIIKLSRNDVDNLIRYFKRLIKPLTDFKHFSHLRVAILRLADKKLLDFFKLMNSKKSMNVLSMGPCLLSKTRRVSAHFYRQFLWLNNFSSVISSQGLLTRCDQIRWLSFQLVHIIFYCL